jgi:hypothetical protein
MGKMHECEVVDASYAANAPVSIVAEVDIKATPEQIFEAFEDADAWPVWALPITNVEWTSPKPYGLGTTRTVTMTGIVGDEVFIAWDYPKNMAFCFTHCSQTLIKSFAEDYIVTDLGNGLTRVKWTMGMTPQGFGKFTMFLFKPFMGFGNQWMFNQFKKYVEKRFA